VTTGSRTTFVFLTILCGLLLTILGLTQKWPAYAWPVLAVLLVALPTATFKIAARRRGLLPIDVEEQRTAPPVERREHRITRVALPTRWADYDFLFSATVRWHPLEAPGNEPVLNPAGLAVDAVLNRAREITEQREPGRPSLVQHELGGTLSRMRPEPTGHLHVMAEDVTLVLREHDQERLDKLAEVRKDEAVWEHQRKYEQSKREYLGGDVLKDTGSAVVWWLAKNDDHVEKTVADLGLLAQLTSAANNTDIPERLRELITPPPPWPAGQGTPDGEPLSARQPTAADHVEAFLDSMGFTDDDPRRAFLAKQIADNLRTQDQHEAADALLRRFDPPARYTPDDSQPTGPEEHTHQPPSAPHLEKEKHGR
jgi:hypothetical protein